ncbi:cation-binding protein [Pseudoflavonifractor sp. 524-17]|uniref:bacteriohemerythrin n=1 Tax=Pseudoflavonifractor sp. 524-17 TaxID=2304577 RepID=UPI0013794192|nr:hemerythrin family protein [Pseudoflavonifractor sp. 524-17]NCE64519.1 cation-binding protein [Pseudoflavonifractor sp. 524-17]
MKYELTKALETGNAVIDREHGELFQAVNRLMDACGKGQGRTALEPSVKFLLDYVDRHFSHEEQLQQKSGYPGMAAHKAFHAGYTKTLREIVSQIPAAGPTVADVGRLNGHIAVLIGHIRTEDKKLGGFLKQSSL